MSIQKICAGFETTLAAKLLAGGTSFSLSSHLTKKGVELSGEYGFILGEGTAVEEWCYGTVVSGVVTIIKRGLDPEDPNIEVPALKFDHDRGSSVKITDYPFLGLIRQYLGGEKDLPAPLKYATHQTPTEDTELIDKKYAQELFTGAIGTAIPSAAGTIFTDHDMGNKPVAKTIIAYEQATPDMTIKVAPFNLAEIDKHVNFAGGNSPTFTAPVTNPRIDILVYDIAAAALEVRAGSENVSPVAPALESGDIAVAKIYHRVGETSLKNSSDGTNGYIMSLYCLSVYRNDVLFNNDPTINAVKVSCILGEDITVSDSPLPVFLGDGNAEAFSQSGYSKEYYGLDGNISIWGVNQGIVVFKTGKYQTRLVKIGARIGKYGTPAGSLVFDIFLADSNHKPTGSSLSSVTLADPNTTLPAVSVSTPLYYINLSSVLNVLPNTEYCLVLKALSASSSANCIQVTYVNVGNGTVYSIGTSPDSGATWSITSGKYTGLDIYGYSDYETGKLYLTDFTDDSRQRINGFITESKLVGETYNLQVNGLISGFSSLITGFDHYKTVDTDIISSGTGSNDATLGYNSSNQTIGQTIKLLNKDTVLSIVLALKKTGLPTDDVVLDIYSAVGGTLLYTSSNSINGADLTTSYQNITFNFNNAILSPSLTYYFRLRRNGALNTSNYYFARYQSTSSYGDGVRYTNDVSDSGDLYFSLLVGYPNETAKSVSGLYLGKALSAISMLLGNFKGMIKKVSESGSYTYGTTTKTIDVPILARKARINFSYQVSSYVFKSQIQIEKGESIEWIDYFGSTPYTFNVSWSGNSITITTYNTSGCSWSSTIYYYN